MQYEAWAMIGTVATGGFGVTKAYFHYRVRLIELKNQRDHEIEDRREELEEDRKRNNDKWLDSFRESVSAVRAEIQSLKARLDTVEPRVEAVDRDIKSLGEKMDRMNLWFDKYKRSDATVVPGKKD